MTNHSTFTRRAFLLLACTAVAGLFFSCSMDFFATSWGMDAQRDTGAITVNADNVTKLLKNARGNPKMSMDILDQIAKDINNASESDKQKLREAALVAAAQATDVGGLVVSGIKDITDAMNSGSGDPVKLLDEIVSSVDMEQARHAGDDLVTILPDVGSDGRFKEDFEASDAELMQAAFVIILGEVGAHGGSVQSYLGQWGADGKRLGGNDEEVAVANDLPEAEKKLAGIMNKLIQQSPNNPLVQNLEGAMTTHSS